MIRRAMRRGPLRGRPDRNIQEGVGMADPFRGSSARRRRAYFAVSPSRTRSTRRLCVRGL